MLKRFGYGYERKSEYNPSTQHARAFFLELIPPLKQEVVPTLFDIAYQTYLELLANNRDEIASIQSDAEAELLEYGNFPSDSILDMTIERFIPDGHTLQLREDATLLCSKLREWSDTWNLSNDWCLDYAFKALQKRYLLTRNDSWRDIYDAWRSANTDLRLDSFLGQVLFNEEMEKGGCLNSSSALKD